MNENQRAAFITAQAAMLNAEIALMVAENDQRAHRGESAAWPPEMFQEVVDRYSGVLAHNNCLHFLRTA